MYAEMWPYDLWDKLEMEDGTSAGCMLAPKGANWDNRGNGERSIVTHEA